MFVPPWMFYLLDLQKRIRENSQLVTVQQADELARWYALPSPEGHE